MIRSNFNFLITLILIKVSRPSWFVNHEMIAVLDIRIILSISYEYKYNFTD